MRVKIKMLIHCNNPMSHFMILSMSLTIHFCFLTRDPDQEHLNPWIKNILVCSHIKLIPFLKYNLFQEECICTNPFFIRICCSIKILWLYYSVLKTNPSLIIHSVMMLEQFKFFLLSFFFTLSQMFWTLNAEKYGNFFQI